MSWPISAARHLSDRRRGLTLLAIRSTHTQSEELAIEVRDLRKSYGGVEAVRGVNFEVARGVVFCLLGPNGAGKTTTTN